MDTMDAISKIGELTVSLIDRVKDGKTAALVTQIQLLNQTVQSSYFAVNKENSDARTKHDEEKSDLKLEIDNLKAKIKNLESEVEHFKAQLEAKEIKLPQPKLNHNI